MTISHKKQAILAEAYREYEPALKRYSFFKVGNRPLSTDLVQETFIKTWNYIARGGHIEMMRSFLYHVLNSLIVDEYRKRKTISLDTLLEKGYEPSITEEPKHLSNMIDGKVALELIPRLPEKYQTILHLRYVQGLSLSEVAAAMGKSKNTIAVQTYRGLEKLKSIYEEV